MFKTGEFVTNKVSLKETRVQYNINNVINIYIMHTANVNKLLIK